MDPESIDALLVALFLERMSKDAGDPPTVTSFGRNVFDGLDLLPAILTNAYSVLPVGLQIERVRLSLLRLLSRPIAPITNHTRDNWSSFQTRGCAPILACDVLAFSPLGIRSA